MMDLLWLGEPACHERARVGGKAAHLSRLAAAYAVPPGFCLPAGAVEALLPPEALAAAGDEPGALEATLETALSDAYAALGERCGRAEPAVAVRSSAVDEDGGLASFAGQHETFLNVVGAAAVAAAVARCWASGRSARALAYRRHQSMTANGAGVAVLVQQMAPADVSAVVFSANPVTSNREEIVITASWGLGESIVGGTVTPDAYFVRKADLALARRDVAEKRSMTVAVPGGTREVAVPRLLQRQPTLTDEQALAAARLALALEADMGWPVDVECAWQGDRLALLQCRAITTLAPEAATAPPVALTA
jgi:pyruvate,water dikinase